MMDNIKLPDLTKLKDVKQRLKDLPPQESANDTSNWENRNVSAVTFDTEAKSPKVRKVDFIMAMKAEGLTLDQLKQKLYEKGYTIEQIKQMEQKIRADKLRKLSIRKSC